MAIFSKTKTFFLFFILFSFNTYCQKAIEISELNSIRNRINILYSKNDLESVNKILNNLGYSKNKLTPVYLSYINRKDVISYLNSSDLISFVTMDNELIAYYMNYSIDKLELQSLKSPNGKELYSRVNLDFFLEFNTKENVTFINLYGKSNFLKKKQELEYIEDKIVDTRYNNEIYYFKSINGKNWLTKNMNAVVLGSEPTNFSGRFYSFEQAKLACPKGWRLPTAQELATIVLKYGKVAYDGYNEDLKSIFGEYDPDLTVETYNALNNDPFFSLSKIETTPKINKVTTEYRTLFWTSTSSNNEVNRNFAIYWDKSLKNIFFSDYPKNMKGYCRCIQE